jgi:hypothetical protein
VPARDARSIAEKPYVKAKDGNLHLFADDLKKVTIQGGEIEYLLPGREPVTVATMADDISGIKETADVNYVTIADKFVAVDKTIADYNVATQGAIEEANVATQGAIAEVKENFKETVDATLTPAVDSLSFRMLKLEGACNYASSWEKTPASGTTIDNFKAPVCATISTCKAKEEFQSKAPTVTSDRVCKAITQCTSTQFIRSEATEASDRVCQTAKKCTVNKEYVFVCTCLFMSCLDNERGD